MSHTVRLSRSAEADLDEIWFHIAHGYRNLSALLE